jgi:hypothetical protein
MDVKSSKSMRDETTYYECVNHCYYDDMEKDRWNQRPIEDSLRAEIAELEAQIFALSTGTRSSRDADRIKELEAWQKEAVSQLKDYRWKMLPLTENNKVLLNRITNLIKQAEEK